MVGRSVEQNFPKVPVDIGAEVLRVENFSRTPEFRDINFSVRRGEILGIYGLVGAGRSEVMQALFGLNPIDSGAIYIDGKQTRIRSPEEAIRHGIALVPEDRQHQGAVLTLPIADNVSLPSLKQLSKFGFLKRVSEYIRAEDLLERLQIKSSGLQQHVRELSGGNQQKVVLAKWLGVNPRVLILDEPTKGIDVGAKSAVHQIMSECVQRGCAIIMVSSELPEVLGMADRVLIMNRGRVCALLDRAGRHAVRQRRHDHARGRQRRREERDARAGSPRGGRAAAAGAQHRHRRAAAPGNPARLRAAPRDG